MCIVADFEVFASEVDAIEGIVSVFVVESLMNGERFVGFAFFSKHDGAEMEVVGVLSRFDEGSDIVESFIIAAHHSDIGEF